ncbi:SRPBCC domain-containing protein [Streptomyces sp. NPDC058632]|uniref:SRPBCC domain-containing protein n=1 Tax=Streptomyces sp. NPDC058632 TaxID=3346567 RepID=UPI003653CBBE
MEHEVFVPVPVERLREALDDPARVARAVPGLQHDAGAEPVAGRLKVRIGSHSVTYRGAVRVSRRDDGSYAVEGDGVEARGTGAVKLALRLTLRDTEGGATLTVHGTATAGGRVAELPPDAVTSAVARLLSRFAANLGTSTGTTAGEAPVEGTPEEGTPVEGTPSSEEPPATESPSVPSAPSVFDAEIPLTAPEPGLQDDVDGTADETADGAADPADGADGADGADRADADAEADEDADEDADADAVADAEADEDAVAEAAHARRTMIGRSAEEVDHAPPRGRYAPVPAPQTVSAVTPLRWAAPAAALAVASAIVAVRALRRRR